jgi:hypothetical protein
MDCHHGGRIDQRGASHSVTGARTQAEGFLFLAVAACHPRGVKSMTRRSDIA